MKSIQKSGFTLIETIIYIVVLSVALVGVSSVFHTTVLSSYDPLEQKQALMISQSLLEEIQLMPFTYCDPTDSNVYTASSQATCALPQVLAPTGTQNRYDPSNSFNNVGDYNGFAMVGIKDITNSPISGLENYSVVVTVSSTAFPVIPASDSLKIDVKVTTPRGREYILTGYKFMSSPNLTL